MAECNHEWLVWTDSPLPIHKFDEGTPLEEVEAFIEEDPDSRYAECDLCGETINA